MSYKKYYKRLVILLVPFIFLAVFNILLSYLIEIGINTSLGLEKGNLSNIIFIFIICVVVFSIFQYIYSLGLATLKNDILIEIRQNILNDTLKANYTKVRNMKSGKLLTLMYDDADNASTLIPNVILPSLSLILSIVIGLVYIFSLAWQLGLISIVLIPIFFHINKYLSNDISEKYPLIKESEEKINNFSKEIINNSIVFKMFNMESRLSNKLDKLGEERKKNAVVKDVAVSKMSYITHAQIMFLQLISIVVGVILLKNDVIMVGALLACINTLIGSVFYPLLDLPDVLVNKSYVNASIKRIEEYRESINELDINKNSITFDKKNDRNVILTCKNLSYSFENSQEKLFEGINFEISKGETISIFGESGAGKTTLIQLFLGLLSDFNGKIIINGEKTISYMPQTAVLFPISIRENIVLGNTNITNEDILTLLKKVNMLSVIEELKYGLDTIVDGSFQLSGGEIQRISIVRTILQSKSLIILDEPLAALDQENRELVLGLIKEIQSKYAIIIVSHNEDVKNISNKTFYLEGGRGYEK